MDNEISTNLEQPDLSTTCVTLKAIVRLFAKLYARYGNQWSSQWDNERILKLAHSEWYEELKHYYLEDIKRGLDAYRGDFPPNLMQFSKACKKPTISLAHQEYVQIEPMKVTPEKAKENIKRLKEAIKGVN